VSNGQLYIGDNSAGGEVNRMRNRLYPTTSAEDSTAIRGVRRVYSREAGVPFDSAPNPKEIQDILLGTHEGNRDAALKAWAEMAIVAGDTLANAITLLDGIIVIGGGLAGAYQVFLQTLVDEMNAAFQSLDGHTVPRLEITALNLENPAELEKFLVNESIQIKVPFSDKTVTYDPSRYIGVGISRLGTSRAVSVGAYAYALAELER
jgi:glucokinase